MNFRIRNLGSDAEFKKSQKAYFRHLRRFKKSSDTDLWKFFYWDFFADGTIHSITVSSDLETVTMKLESPNIRRFLSKGGYEYINAAFTCTFSNVVNFQTENTSPAECLTHNKESLIFPGAEINTSPLLPKLADIDELYEFHSLLIETLVDNTIVWLELVFTQVNVVPDEPLAFSLMEYDHKFEVPAFYPKKIYK